MSDWRKTREYRIWRATVIMRDKRCVVCNSIKGRNAHHINHASYFPELRFDPDNGVCMCNRCHNNYHNNYHISTRHKCTSYDFNNFISLASYLFEIKQEQVAALIVPIMFGDGEPVPAPTIEQLCEIVNDLNENFFVDGKAISEYRKTGNTKC